MPLAVIAAAAAVSAGTGIYNSIQQGKTASSALGLAQDTQGKQDQYNQQLQALMQNPSSFLQNPLFQSTLNQGLSGVSRQLAAQGYLGSGNEMTALEQYGQTSANSQLLSQEQLLASLSGAQTASSPAQALGVATGAQTSANNQMGGALASLGYTLQNYGGGAGATASIGNFTNNTIDPFMSGMWGSFSPSIGTSVPGA